MPRCVRNFWLELDVDGSRTKIATGPKSSEGGFNLVIRLREKGEISETRFYVTGTVSHDDAGERHVSIQAYSADSVGNVLKRGTALKLPADVRTTRAKRIVTTIEGDL